MTSHNPLRPAAGSGNATCEQHGPLCPDKPTPNDPGPVPDETPREQAHTNRARVIAAIHGMAGYLAEHPDIPTPHTINFVTSPGGYYELADDTRLAIMDEFAAGHDAVRSKLPGDEGKEHHYAKVETYIPGTRITLTMSTTTEATPHG